MRRVNTLGAMIVAVSSLSASSAAAHPIHTTLTAIRAERGEITLMVRTFADDFSASVATLAGKKPPADWSVQDPDVARYLSTHVRVLDASGKALPLRSCGIRRDRDLYWVCVRVEGATDVRGLRAENSMLTERHADQVNIVQVNVGGTRKTLLFTKQTRAQPLSE